MAGECIVKVPKYSVYDDYDFIGFSFNGYHCVEDLNIYRTSGGGMYSESITPQIQEKTGQHPGVEGAYLLDVQHRQRVFDISFAFDSLTDDKIQLIKQVFAGKEIGELWFDEYPYKVWDAKVTGQPMLKVIPFGEDDGPTIYKGEGTIQFTAYYPYAHTPDYVQWDDNETEAEWKTRDGKLFSSYAPFRNKEQWKEAANLWESIPAEGLDIRGEAPSDFYIKFNYSNLELEYINNWKYYSAIGLKTPVKNLVIPKTYKNISIGRIGEDAFGDETINSVIVQGMVRLFPSAFSGCKNLNSVSFEEDVAHAQGEKVFLSTQPISKLKIPLLQDEVQIGALFDYSFVENKNSRPEGYMAYLKEVELTGKGALRSSAIPTKYFAFCPELTKVTIGEGMTEIGEYAFLESDKLASISLPQTLDTIKEGAFSHCINLTTLSIPNKVTTIPDWGFYKCEKLQNLTYGYIDSIGQYAFYETNLNMKTLFLGQAEIGAYSFACPDSTYRNRFETLSCSSTIINNNAFEKTYIASIKLFDTGVGEKAFRGILGQTEVSIAFYSYLGNKAFENSEITKVSIGEGVSFGEYCFTGCSELAEVNFLEDFNSDTLPLGCFNGCTSLEEITIPPCVTTIKEYFSPGYGNGIWQVVFSDKSTGWDFYRFNKEKGEYEKVGGITIEPSLFEAENAPNLAGNRLTLYRDGIWRKRSNG